MASLLLRLRVNLEDHSIPFHPNGPLFHRWLPDGEKDALTLETGDPAAVLAVWFERWGYLDRGQIRFSYNRLNVDPQFIRSQALLEGGPLLGRLAISNSSDDELSAVLDSRQGDEAFVRLAKRVVTRLLYPPLSRFVTILRTNYGQYWLNPLKQWDSRYESLSSYCEYFGLQWSTSDGASWTDFRPDDHLGNSGEKEVSDYREYFDSEDWQDFRRLCKNGYEPSSAMTLLARSHRMFDNGELKYAFIEGTSALELALSEFFKQDAYASHPPIAKQLQSFWNLPLPSQLAVAASASGRVSPPDLTNALKAISIRNRVIHEGYEPPAELKSELQELLRAVAVLLPGCHIKFPILNAKNIVKPVEQWDEEPHEAND